jgi:hypothetical protein
LTDYEFKSGIKIHMPEGVTFQQWTDFKMIMDILIGTPSRGKEIRLRPDNRGKPKGWKAPKKVSVND